MKKNIFLLFIGSTLLLLSSCAETNVDTIRGGTIQVNDYRDFIGSEDRVWKALINALSEKEIIKVFDRGSGLVVTDYGTVAGRELEAVKTLLLAMTYKYSYTVNLLPQAGNKTRIRVKVNLLGQQVGFYEREVSDIAVEKYLTKDLFDRICNSLSPGNPYGCSEQNQARSNYSQKQSSYVNRPSSFQNHKGDPLTRSVQQRLRNLGYAPGPVDGKMGNKTRNAIIRFQKDNGLTAHSKLDMVTLQALGVNGVPEPVPQQFADNERISLPKGSISPDSQIEQSGPALKNEIAEETVAAVTLPAGQDSNAEKLTNGYHYVTLSQTIVKKEKNVMADNLGKIPENSDIIVLQEGMTWHTIRFKNQTGYVLAALVDKREGEASVDKQNEEEIFKEEIPAKKQLEDRKISVASPVVEQKVETTPALQKQKPASEEPESIGTGTVNGVTHLYVKPSVMSSKHMKLNGGETVEIYGEQKGFYEVKINNREGFVYKDFVDTDK